MKCIYCNKQQRSLKIGGIITITCCSKIQMLRYSVRPRVRELLKDDPDTVLVDIKRA